MIRAHRVSATAQDDASLVAGWNVAPNVAYILRLLPGVASCGVLLYDENSVLVASGAALSGTEQPCVLTPQAGQAVGMVDADLNWHLLLTTTGTESQRTIRIAPSVDLPDEIHPVYADADMGLARAIAAIDEAAHYRDDVTVSCPLGLGAGLGDVVSAPVDDVPVAGQAESATWTATPGGTTEQGVIRRHVAIAPEPAAAPLVPPAVADDTGETDSATTTSGNVLEDDASGLVVVAVNGLAANVGAVVDGNNGGAFTIASDGAWTFDPDGDFAALSGSETADTSINYHASDGTAEAMATLTVNVSAASATPWTPAEITTTLWLDDSGVNGSDFDGSARPAATSNIVIPTYCGVFIAMDTSSITTTQVALEHSINYNNNYGSFLLTAGEAPGHINYGFRGTSGTRKYVLRYPVASGKLTLSLLHNSARNLSVFNHGAALTGVNVDTTAYTFAAQTANLPIFTGARSGGGLPVSGTIREVIITPTVPTEDTRQKIEGYLAHKWDGMLSESARVAALPAGHPYKSAPPTI